jgi:CRP-like cAMP-binding protein
MENLADILTKVPLFNGLPKEEIQSIVDDAHYQIVTYEKGQLIFQAGEELQKLIILLEGKITAEMLNPSGKALKIEDATAPQTLATAFMYGPKQKIPVNITTRSNCKFMFIPKPEFQRIMLTSPKLLSNYIDTISARAQFLSDKLKFMSFNTIRQKIAHFLLDKMADENEPFHAGISQTAMAELFGVARPSLARCISEMENDGIIYSEKGYFTVFSAKTLNSELMD